MAWPLVQASDSTSLLVSGALLKPHTNLFLQLFASILFNREMKRNRIIPSKTKTNLSRPNTKSSFPVAAYRRDSYHLLHKGAGGNKTIDFNKSSSSPFFSSLMVHLLKKDEKKLFSVLKSTSVDTILSQFSSFSRLKPVHFRETSSKCRFQKTPVRTKHP